MLEKIKKKKESLIKETESLSKEPEDRRAQRKLEN